MDVLAAAVVQEKETRAIEGARGISGTRGEQGPRGEQGEDGQPGLIWRGPWMWETEYQPGDIVESSGSAYVAVWVVKHVRPPQGSWELLAARGLDGLGAQGPQGAQGAAGSAGADAPSTLDIHLYGWDGSAYVPVLGDEDGRLMVTS